jgi:non-specific serine/threonine protein kinase
MEVTELTSFVGRAWEIGQIRALLASSRLVTLTGAGGCGKTRLALRAAASVGREVSDSLTVVELAGITDPGLLPRAIAAARYAPEAGGVSPVDWLLEDLGTARALLVVDNCEHLRGACAELMTRLLSACPDLHLLCTSREPLRVVGETAWLVPSLSYPPEAAPADTLSGYEAVQLFVDRARNVRGEFGLTDTNAEAIAGICRRLEGLPLGVELAAARVNVLTPAQILQLLDDALSLLRLPGGLIPRQQTLAATLDWSHGLLSDQERIAFRRMGVFSGPFDLEAATGVCGGHGLAPSAVLDTLADLVDRSLLIADTSREVAGYRMLEPVRQYALARLEASDEEQAVRGAHFDYHLRLTQEAEPHFLSAPDQESWLARLGEAHPELRSALSWGFDAAPGRASDLAAGLGWFWWFRGHFDEGRAWMAKALQASHEPTPVRGKLQAFSGRLASQQGDHRKAASFYLAAARTFRQLHDDSGLAFALFDLGVAARATGRLARARTLLQAGLALERRLGDEAMVAYHFQELGVLAMADGREGEADGLFREAIARHRALGNRWGLCLNLGNLAELLIHRGDTSDATQLLAESLDIAQGFADPFMLAQLLDYAGMAAVDGGRAAAGLRLFGAGDSMRARLHTRASSAHRDLVNRWRQQAERLLGPGNAVAAWRAGEDMPAPDAVATARATLAPISARAAGLSPREQQTATLVADGLTNREIAERLHLSERTVENHVQHVLNKLGARSRAQIAAWMSRQASAALN